jgi:hypothetical protein
MSRGDFPDRFIEPTDGREKGPEEASTGLPWPHSWRGVYLLVLASFVIWVALLTALQRFFR